MTRTRLIRWGRPWFVLAAIVVATAPAAAQQLEPSAGIFGDARAFEGRPEVRIDTNRDGASRQILDTRDAHESLLTLTVADGRLYWGNEPRPLTVTSAGDFVYLSSSTEPGRYVRVRRVNDRLTYVEHVDKGAQSVTYWGELRVVLGR